MNLNLIEILPWVIFAAVSIAFLAIAKVLTAPRDRATERLDELTDPHSRDRNAKKAASNVSTFIEKAAPKLSKALEPKTELEQSALQVRLANAGYSNSNARQVFLALKVSLAVVGLIVGSSYGLLVYGVTQQGMTAIVLAVAAGMYLPEILLSLIRSSRQEKIFLSMPDALDLLVVCVEAGLGLDAALRRVTDELNDTAPELCEEFGTANLQMQMGRHRRDVLHDLGVRTGVDDMRSLAAILIQTDRFGSSIAQALRVQSESMRTRRSQMAEERAQKTAVQMLIPLVLFIFPGIFVVLVGPAAIMMYQNMLSN